MSSKYDDLDSFIQSIVTKRYPRTRIQRILTHLMVGLDRLHFMDIRINYPSYIRVLGANENGFKLLRKIKESSHVPIITKFSKYKRINNHYVDKTISFDKKATDLFFLGIDSQSPFMDRDYYTTCYIEKNSK